MLDTLGNVFYIVILLLFASTFLPKTVRRQVRAALAELWQLICQITIHVIEPAAYRVVTGQNPHARAGDWRRPRAHDLALARDATLEESSEPRTEPFEEAIEEIAQQNAN